MLQDKAWFTTVAGTDAPSKLNQGSTLRKPRKNHSSFHVGPGAALFYISLLQACSTLQVHEPHVGLLKSVRSLRLEDAAGRDWLLRLVLLCWCYCPTGTPTIAIAADIRASADAAACVPLLRTHEAPCF